MDSLFASKTFLPVCTDNIEVSRPAKPEIAEIIISTLSEFRNSDNSSILLEIEIVFDRLFSFLSQEYDFSLVVKICSG